MKLSERIKGIFAKAADEAAKVADEDKPEEKKAADAFPPKEEEKKSQDAGAYDELVTAFKDLSAKFDSFSKKGGDALPPKEEEKPAVDATPEQPKSLEDRLAALEAAVSKMIGAATDADKEDKSEDADMEEESEDSGMGCAVNMTGDEKSRVEILAPGLEPVKDAKREALEAAYKTKEGRAVIDSISGGKPTFDSAEKVGTLFIAASELLKARRSNDLATTRTVRDSTDQSKPTGAMTAERINEINAKHYANR